MKSVTPSLATAIVLPERVIKHNVTVDWDNDNLITDIDDMSHKLGSVSVTQSLESSLPAQVRVVPGAAVAELDMSIERGNTFRYDVASSYKSVSSSTSGSTTSSTISVPVPAGLQDGDVVIVTLFTSERNFYDLLVKANVDWAPLALRANDDDTLLIQMQSYTRRVPVGGEIVADYKFTLAETQVWVATAVRIGDPYLMGITQVSAKGQDNDPTLYTVVTQTPIQVNVPNSTIVSLYAAHVPVSGTGSWTPLGGDTEVLDVSTTRTSTNITAAVEVASNVAQGTYLKQATLTPAATASAVVGIAIVLAPKLAGDERQHAAWTFSELNPDSPYGGKTRTRRETTWKVGLYTDAGLEEVQIFTGLSLTAGGSSRNRTASLVANDNRELMRNPWFLPDWVADAPISSDTEDFTIPTLPGLETTAVISYLFAWSQYRIVNGSVTVTQPRDMGPFTGYGFFAAPPMRPACNMLWAPLHGTMSPFRGDMMSAYTRLAGGQYRHVRFAVGPYVAGTEAAPSGGFSILFGKWRCRSDFAQTWSTTTQVNGRLEFWGRVGTTANTGVVQFMVADDTIALTKVMRATVTSGANFNADVIMPGGVTRNIAGPATPTDGAWHFYGLHIDSLAGNAYFRIDGMTTVVSFATWVPGSTTVDSIIAQLQCTQGAQAAELMVHGGLNTPFEPTNPNVIMTDTPWIIENFTPTAYIDKSINEIDAIPPGMDNGSDFWEIASEIAAAEFSAIYFDGDGALHFRNTRSDVEAAGQVVQRVLTARSTLRDLQYENGVRQIANVVSIGYTPMTAYVNSQVFSPSGALRVPASSTISISFPLPGVIVNSFIAFLNPVSQDGNTAPDGSGVVITNMIPTIFLSVRNFTGVLNVENPNPYDVYMVDTTGQSTVTVIGTYVGPTADQVSPVIMENLPSIRKYDVQPIQLSTSAWIQREEVATSFAILIVSELGEPRPVIKNMPIKGDPRLQLGDLHGVQDVNGLGVNGNYRLTGLAHQADSNGTYNQDVTVRQASAVAHWNVNYWNDGTVWGV